MPSNVPSLVLKLAFSSVLSRNHTDEGSGEDLSSLYIQAVNVHPRLFGLVVLAFWDLRDAARARTACLKGDVSILGAHLTCRFVAVEELRAV